MVLNRSMIPNGHFHKDWQRYIKTNFNQPIKKQRRKILRKKKAAQNAPRPLKLLRPIVRCPSVRYHTKVRCGRGFTVAELRTAGINRKWAFTVGIAVDSRRRNKSFEAINQNSQRLREYVEKLIIFSKGKPKQQQFAIANDHINAIPVKLESLKPRNPTEEEKRFEAYVTLRKARADLKLVGKRKKKLAMDDGMGNKFREKSVRVDTRRNE